MTHSARNHLQLGLESYDLMIRRFIPGYESMLEVVADTVAAAKPSRVTDLGAGTGALSEALLKRSEIGGIELVDIDPEMMKQAQVRLEAFGDRAHWGLRSFEDPLSPCDVFVASLSLHHIPTIEAKQALFDRAYHALPPGGIFVNADAHMPKDESEQKRRYQSWAAHLVASGIEEARAWQYFDEWSEEDTYLSIEEELGALRKVGFETERVWQKTPVSVIVGRKPMS